MLDSRNTPATSETEEIRPISGKPSRITSGNESLPVQRALQIYRLMVRTRVMEERMIKMSKSGEGYFWVGGPGEEAFQVCLGLQVKRGQGPAYDYLHLHYRNSGVMLGMGMPMIDGIRQMAMTATDPNSMGRNFVGHYAKKEWNVMPVTSVIEIQYTMAPGTAMMQQRHGGDGVSIVLGGDAGTAEGDFATCMIWSTIPGKECPVLIGITNNSAGISTLYDTQHAEKQIIDRGKAFGIPGAVVDGNDPITCWHALDKALRYCRKERRPYMLEAMVSRLHGHSSSSGAARITEEPDCLELFQEKLIDHRVLTDSEAETIYQAAHEEVEAAIRQAMSEPQPTPADIPRFTYAPSPVDAVYPDDYTGLPGTE